MQIKLGLVANHVDYHEDHLFLLVGELNEVDLRQLELVVNLKHVLVSGECVDCVVVRHRSVLIDLHSGCATAHCSNKLY